MNRILSRDEILAFKAGNVSIKSLSIKLKRNTSIISGMLEQAIGSAEFELLLKINQPVIYKGKSRYYPIPNADNFEISDKSIRNKKTRTEKKPLANGYIYFYDNDHKKVGKKFDKLLESIKKKNEKTKEKFVPLDGFEGLYEISKTTIRNTKTGYIRKQGSKQFSLSKDGIMYPLYFPTILKNNSIQP